MSESKYTLPRNKEPFSALVKDVSGYSLKLLSDEYVGSKQTGNIVVSIGEYPVKRCFEISGKTIIIRDHDFNTYEYLTEDMITDKETIRKWMITGSIK